MQTALMHYDLVVIGSGAAVNTGTISSKTLREVVMRL